MAYTRERLGEVLVRAGLINDAQLLIALDQQQLRGGKLGEVLVQELIVTEDQLAEALAEQKDLKHVSLAASRIDAAAAVLLPLRMARRRLVIPIGIEEDRLVLAMADPLDVEAIDEAEFVSGMKVEPVVAAASQVRYAIEKYIAGVDALQELELVDRDEVAERAPSDADSLDDEAAVVRAVNRILREAVADRSSDIHFEPSAD
ncbi:MAG: type II secretion system protein GspE, partial [Actinobacteria bacterium]